MLMQEEMDERMRQYGYRRSREGDVLKGLTIAYSVAFMLICSFLAVEFYAHASVDVCNSRS